MIEHRDEGDLSLAAASSRSSFFPDDAPYVTAAWREYCDQYRQDRARAPRTKAGKPKARFPISWDTDMALQRYFDACEIAHQEGYPAHAGLDVHSYRPQIAGDEDDETDDDE